MLKNLFKRKEKTIVFIDFEHWYYSCKNLFQVIPSLDNWLKSVPDRDKIAEIHVFGNFEHSEIGTCLNDLRKITPNIIETGTNFFMRKKDMSDFVMLDSIYQTAAERNEFSTYILITGDAHFRSVVRYLIEKKQKQVIVYGVAGAFSKELKSAASDSFELPLDDERYLSYCKMIISNMAYVSDKESIIPTFMTTAESVAKYNRVPKDRIIDAMRRMIDDGYLYQRERYISFNHKTRVVAVRWEKVRANGLWEE